MTIDSIPEVYVDTNGWSDLFRSDSARDAQMRRDLRAAARTGRLRVLTSGWAIEELGGIAAADWAEYRRIVEFAFELIGGALIEQTGTLVDRELRAGRRLRRTERFFSAADVEKWRRATARPDLVRGASEEFRAKGRASAIEGQRLREQSWSKLAQLAEGDPKAATLEWHAEATRWIDEWSRDALAGRLERLGRDRGAAATYPLERVPTVRNVVAEMLARVAWNVGHGRRIQPSDDADTHHYAAARYADIFVSGDDDLAEIVALIPGDAQVRPMSMLEFARAHLGWARFTTQGRTLRAKTRAAEAAP